MGDSWQQNPRTPQMSFDKRFVQLQAWVNGHDGRLPKRAASNGDEKLLGNFINHIQSAVRGVQGRRLLVERERLLRTIPGMVARMDSWQQNPRRPHTSFDERFVQLQAWVNGHDGRLPKRASSNDDEKRLGNFINIIYKAVGGNRDQRLSAERERLLRTIPAMAERMDSWQHNPRSTPHPQKSSDDRFVQLQAWVDEYGG